MSPGTRAKRLSRVKQREEGKQIQVHITYLVTTASNDIVLLRNSEECKAWIIFHLPLVRDAHRALTSSPVFNGHLVGSQESPTSGFRKTLRQKGKIPCTTKVGAGSLCTSSCAGAMDKVDPEDVKQGRGSIQQYRCPEGIMSTHKLKVIIQLQESAYFCTSTNVSA
jgi:hypothetical protein